MRSAVALFLLLAACGGSRFTFTGDADALRGTYRLVSFLPENVNVTGENVTLTLQGEGQQTIAGRGFTGPFSTPAALDSTGRLENRLHLGTVASGTATSAQVREYEASFYNRLENARGFVRDDRYLYVVNDFGERLLEFEALY